MTVTVWAVLQLAFVNVRLAGATKPSAVLLLASGITTSAVGWLPSTTVNVALPPASLVIRPATGVTVMAGPSLSVLVADTSAGFMPL